MYGKENEKVIDAEMLRKILMRGSEDDEFMMGDSIITMTSNAHVYFYADVAGPSVLKLNNILVQLAKDNLAEAASKNREVEPIHLHIQSPGGLVSAGLIGYDTIIEIGKHVPIFSYIDGHCASAATLLSIAASKRFVTPSSTMLIHELSSWFGGKMHELTQEYHNSMKIQSILEEIYSRHSKIKKDELKELLKKDVLLTASEALEYGLVDEIKINIF